MGLRHTSNRLLALLVLALLGFLLFYAPQKILAQYQALAGLSPWWRYAYVATVGTGAAIFLGITGWLLGGLWLRTRRKKLRRKQRSRQPSELSHAEKQQELNENLTAVEDLSGEDKLHRELKSELQAAVAELRDKHQSQQLEIVAFGTISSGKSSVLNALAGRDVFQTDPKGGTTIRRNEIAWSGADRVLLVDTPGLGEVDGQDNARVAAEAARDADLVLLVVDGPLRDDEFRLLVRLAEMEKRILVCLNKGDWYAEPDRSALVGQLVEQIQKQVRSEDVVTIRAHPAQRTRIRVLPDGSELEETVPVEPDIGPLAQRMLAVVRHDGQELLAANLLLQSRGLVEQSREKVRRAIDERAWAIVDKYMWSAGGAAALIPLPLIDLAAGTALSVKMVAELAEVYRQPVDGNVIVDLLGQLGKNLLAILGVSAATPAVVSGVGSLLKMVPGAGQIAGGLLQGVVQAIVTRWIGAVFIRYFQNEMREPEGGLAQLARGEWQRITSVDELRKLVQLARGRLGRGTSQADGSARTGDRVGNAEEQR